MSAWVKQATEHWHYVAPLLNKPGTEQEYRALAAALDEVLEMTGDDEDHPLMGLVHHMGDQVQAYETEHYPMAEIGGVAFLKYLMEERSLGQGDLPEIGNQSVVSLILNGKRQLNIRQLKALSQRFHFPVDAFI